MRVIGTAGHVDHGKTTLVAALTGINPDRLKEEQEREMTIDLGFAWMTLPDGEEVGIVDVPGHRDFIENMLAGVGGIDAALLVIAADEGIMPQTREHLHILDLLQIQTGIIVLTKTDLIEDPGWLDLVETDIRDLVKGTVLKDAAVVRVSSRKKTGLDELVGHLSQILKNCPKRPDLGRPRLPIDRVFSIAGFGTVVTGTLSDGHLQLGDEVEILPSGVRGRIRGLQTHKKKEDTAFPGSRTAVNISGVNADQIHRGEVVAHPGQYRSSRRMDVLFHLLPDARPIEHNDEVKIFLAASETVAVVRLLGTEILQPGQEGWLQLELRIPVVAARGDRYIIRRPSPGETLGGGRVIDPFPKKRHKRSDERVILGLESLARGSPADVLLQASLALGPAQVKDVVQRARLEERDAADALEELKERGQILALEEGPVEASSETLVITQELWSSLRAQVEETIATYHRNHPLRRGIPKEELKSRLKLQPRVLNALLRTLCAMDVLEEIGSWVALKGHEIKFEVAQQAKVDALMQRFAQNPYSPPTIKECQAEVGEDILTALIEMGDLVAVSDEVVFRRKDYESMLAQIRQLLKKQGQITIAELRDLFNTSRRYMLALMEHLDASGVTVRDGDSRSLKK